MKTMDLLRQANVLQAYTLIDRGSWPALRNPYSVILVNSARHPGGNPEGARRLIAWLRSPPARALIANHKLDGETLFHPASADPGTVVADQ